MTENEGGPGLKADGLMACHLLVQCEWAKQKLATWSSSLPYSCLLTFRSRVQLRPSQLITRPVFHPHGRRSSRKALRRPRTGELRAFFSCMAWRAIPGLLRCCSGQRASSCDDEGSTWIFSSVGGILELRRGSQPSPWVGPGKPNLPLGREKPRVSLVIAR